MHELRLALRQLRRTPVVTAIAVLSLAIGIGVNTAVFTLVNAFLIRALPVADPDALVLFRAVHGAQGRMSRRGEGSGFVDPATGRDSGTSFSRLAYERIRGAEAGLTEVWAFSPFSRVHVLVDGVPETSVSAQFVSGTYYAGLGVTAALGRVIEERDDQPSATAVAVISHRFWMRRFGGSPSVLGTTVSINRVPATVIGVTPEGFDGALQAGETADLSVALSHHAAFQPDRAERAEPYYWWLRIMGRRQAGATPAGIRAALEPVFQRAAIEGWDRGAAVEPTTRARPDQPLLSVDPGAQGENDVRRQYARSMRILMGLVSLVLIGACANVTNLLLARGHHRRREMAVRMAVGASGRQLVQQLLAESLLLAGAAAVLGIAVAGWSRDALLALRPFGATAVILDLPLDLRVLLFTISIALISALVCGLAPALRATRVDVKAEFLGGPGAIGHGAGSRLSRALMVVQVALALVLLVTTTLFTRTVARLDAVDAGFNRDALLLFRIDATSAGYDDAQAAHLHASIRDRLARLPGVQAATFSRVALLSRARQNMSFTIVGQDQPATAPLNVHTNGIDAGFLDAMGLRLLAGRSFTDRDDERAARVAVVNQALARTYFGDASPLGRVLEFNAPGFRHRVEVVGVVNDAKYTDLRGAAPATAYFPALQQPDGAANFAVRTHGRQAAMLKAITAAVREVDPDVPVLNLRTQEEQVERLHGQERLFATLAGGLGFASLVLACVGLYGLLSDAVAHRRREIGVRIALGAYPLQLQGMVVGESLRLAGAGVLLGVAAAAAASRLVTSMLFEVSPTDPLTYLAVAGGLLAATLLAAALPAHRASRVEPVEALKIT